MRITRSLKAAALIAAAVVLGLFTVQGTFALWNASAVAAPGTVSAASFDVALTAVNSGTTTNMTLANGAAANLVLSPAGTLGPGSPVSGGVVVTNNTNAGGQFNTATTVGQPTVANTGGGTLASYIIVSAKIAVSATECSSSTGYAQIGTGGLVSPTVGKGGSTIFCFQVSLASSAPSTVKGQAVTISLPLTARQLCGVPSGC
ncbi:hypothetical protein [Pseudarthrobacter sp. lyk4-40-TYG-27]|uniref:hypothetical protein n=1 Tax=Pseudarthrobacter sp. lyk4-40-TYG-27 TaxID=3040305 RepID=UPI002554D1D3|nr:hypothetical protein [Pseudarthrobacter sp. lyk4-40-TYG-27]